MTQRKRGNDETRDKPFRIALRELRDVIRRQSTERWIDDMWKKNSKTDAPEVCRVEF